MAICELFNVCDVENVLFYRMSLWPGHSWFTAYTGSSLWSRSSGLPFGSWFANRSLSNTNGGI